MDETDSGVRESFRTCYWVEAADCHTFGVEHGASEEAGHSNRDRFRKVVVPGWEVDNNLLDIPIELVGHRPMAEHPSEARPVLVPSM